MDPDRWQRVAATFEAALEQSSTSRERWLREACGDDVALLDQVTRLLHADASRGGAVDQLDAGELLRAADAMLGRRVGAFRLVERLAAGGMGVVYRGERCDGLFEQQVAVKIVRAELVDADMLRRFDAERRTLATLEHPHIARLYDGGTDDEGRPFFVIELVRGAPIDRWCDERGLGVAARLRMFALVCRAVHHAHCCLVVHRDLKPANILVDESGQPKLVDFGIARVVAEHGAVDGRDETLSSGFTPGYASPEQIAGKPTTTSVDVFALGVVLHQLLCGERPFPTAGRTPLQWQHDVLERQPPRPSACATGALARRLRGDLDRIVAMALRKEPERRYASALDLALDLERHLAGLPVRAREDSLAYRVGRFVQRHVVVVAAAAVTVAALAVGLVAALKGRAAAERSAAHAAFEAESSQELADFLMETFLTSAVAEDEQQLDAARQAIDDHAARVRLQYHDQPHQRANQLDALGRVATRLGLDELAESLLREGLTVRSEELADEPIERSRSLQALGRLLHARGEFDAAAALLQDGLRIQRETPRGSHSNVAAFANDLAACLRALDRLDEAEQLHREALSLRVADGARSLPVAESLNNLAAVRLQRGDTAQARELIEQALSMRREFLGEHHELTVQLVANLAAAVFRSGDEARAEQLLSDAEAGYRALRVAGESGLAQVLANRAVLARRRGAPAAALPFLVEAREVLARRLGEQHVRLAALWGETARAQQQLGAVEHASVAWQRALEILVRDEAPVRALGEALVEAAATPLPSELGERALLRLRAALDADDELLQRASAVWPPR